MHMMVKIGSYRYVAGALGTWQKGSGNVLSFHVQKPVDDTETFRKFSRIEVDGKKVDAEHFESRPGSVNLTLLPAYLETLQPGTHTLNTVFTDGEAETVFTILEADSRISDLPKTGDDTKPVLYLACTVLGLAGIAWLRKREH